MNPRPYEYCQDSLSAETQKQLEGNKFVVKAHFHLLSDSQIACDLPNAIVRAIFHCLHLVAPLIAKSYQRQESITPAERLSVTLRYLATGDSHQTIAFSYRLGHSTVNKIVPETCLTIWNALSPIYVQCPATTKEWENVAKEFWKKWNFPLCIRAVDGKHVRCHCPANTGSLYFDVWLIGSEPF